MAPNLYILSIAPYVQYGYSFAEIHRQMLKVYPDIKYCYVRRLVIKLRMRMITKMNQKRRLERKFDATDMTTIENEVISSYNRSATTTSTDIVSQLRDKYSMRISSSYLRAVRKRIGFKRVTAKYAQLIRDANKERRVKYALLVSYIKRNRMKQLLDKCFEIKLTGVQNYTRKTKVDNNLMSCYRFCEAAIARKDRFVDVIFSDECTVQMSNNHRIAFIRGGDYHSRIVQR